MKNFICIGICAVLMSVIGCATVEYSFVNPDAKVGAERKVAIFPFEVAIEEPSGLRVGTSSEEAAIVQGIFLKELILRTRYEIISPAEVSKNLSMDEEKTKWISMAFLGDVIERGALTPERLRELGSQLNADAIIAGRVTDFSCYQQDGSLWTTVGFKVKMVDVKTGEILWEARDTIRDVSTTTHNFTKIETKTASYPIVAGGVDREPKYKTGQGYFYASGDLPYHTAYEDTALKICRKIVATLPRY